MKQSLQKLLALALIFASGVASAGTNEAPKVEHRGIVYMIPIKGEIESALMYVIRRGANEAREAKADAVVFEMDTPGGTLQAAEEICRILQSLPMPTYTLVEKDAFSAGAIIALATKKIFMEPGSVIGDAMPIMMGMFGGVEQMPDDIKEKMTSAVSALIRANAQQNGYDPQLAECMVRRDMEYKIGDDIISRSNRLLTLTNIEAERPVGAEKKPLLSSGTVKDLPALLEKNGLAGAEIRTLEVTAAERIARWIAAISPLLLMAGLLGIYIEFKSPGLIMPGVLGALCLVLFFWGQHIAGLSGMEEVVIFGIGIVLLIVEIYVLPGHIAPGVIGIICIFAALLMAMTPRIPNAPNLPVPIFPTWPDLQIPLIKIGITIIGAGLGAALLARSLPGSRLASPLVLAHAEGTKSGFVSATQEASLVGQTGEAVSMLRPAGTARFGGKHIDVVTRGDFIQPGAKIRVVEAQGSRVVVEAV